MERRRELGEDKKGEEGGRRNCLQAFRPILIVEFDDLMSWCSDILPHLSFQWILLLLLLFSSLFPLLIHVMILSLAFQWVAFENHSKNTRENFFTSFPFRWKGEDRRRRGVERNERRKRSHSSLLSPLSFNMPPPLPAPSSSIHSLIPKEPCSSLNSQMLMINGSLALFPRVMSMMMTMLNTKFKYKVQIKWPCLIFSTNWCWPFDFLFLLPMQWYIFLQFSRAIFIFFPSSWLTTLILPKNLFAMPLTSLSSVPLKSQGSQKKTGKEFVYVSHFTAIQVYNHKLCHRRYS